MKKRILPLLLTLALCLSLTAPALAAGLPKDAEEAMASVSLSYTLGDGYTGSFTSGVSVKKPWVLHWEDIETGDMEKSENNGYFAIRQDTVFTVSCAPSDENTLVRIYFTPYVHQGGNDYLWEDAPHSSYLTKKIGFLTDVANPDDEEAGGLVELKPGESFSFTLPYLDLGEDGIAYLEITKLYPDFTEEGGNENEGFYSHTPAWYRSMYLKVDEAAVASGVKDLKPAEPETPEEKPAEEPAAPKFTDVAADSPFAAAIDWAVEQGITNGTTETTFGPSNPCTVSHILTFLWRANGKPGAAEGVADRDSAAKWAVEKGMIAEGDDVNAICTRSMAVTFMWKNAGSPKAEKAVSFTDVAEDAGYVDAVSWAVANGVTNGTSDTTFAPDNGCTRGQIVTFLFRAMAKPQ